MFAEYEFAQESCRDFCACYFWMSKTEGKCPWRLEASSWASVPLVLHGIWVIWAVCLSTRSDTEMISLQTCLLRVCVCVCALSSHGLRPCIRKGLVQYGRHILHVTADKNANNLLCVCVHNSLICKTYLWNIITYSRVTNISIYRSKFLIKKIAF